MENFSYANIENNIKKAQQKREELKKLAMKYLLKLAKANNFPCVVGEYSGEGDSGGINLIDVYTEGFEASDFSMAYDKRDNNRSKKLNSMPFPADFPEELKYSVWTDSDSASLYSAFECLFNRVTPDGYEINNGGHGVVVVDAESNQVSIEHATIYTEESYTSESFRAEELEG